MRTTALCRILVHAVLYQDTYHFVSIAPIKQTEDRRVQALDIIRVYTKCKYVQLSSRYDTLTAFGIVSDKKRREASAQNA